MSVNDRGGRHRSVLIQWSDVDGRELYITIRGEDLKISMLKAKEIDDNPNNDYEEEFDNAEDSDVKEALDWLFEDKKEEDDGKSSS